MHQPSHGSIPPRLSAQQRIAAAFGWLVVASTAVLLLIGRTSHASIVAGVAAAIAAAWALSKPSRALMRGTTRSAWNALRDEQTPLISRARAALLLIGAPVLLACLATNRSAVSGDTAAVMPSAISFVRTGTLRLDEFAVARARERGEDGAALPYFLRQTGSGVRSSYPVGMTLFALPVAAAARVVGANLDQARIIARLEKLTAAIVAAGCATLLMLLLMPVMEPVAAIWLTAAVAFGSPLFSTVGQGLWQHGGVIFWLLAGLLAHRAAGTGSAWSLAMVVGACCGLAIGCRLIAVLFAAPLLLCTMLRGGRAVIAVAGGLGLTLGPVLAYYSTVYGSPLGPSDTQTTAAAWSGALAPHLAEVLISPGRGALVYCPWLLAAAAWPLLSSRFGGRPSGDTGVAGPHSPALAWLLGCAAAAQLMIVASWGMWWGGHCYGPRLLAESIVVVSLLAAPVFGRLWQFRVGRWLAALLIVAAGLIHTIGFAAGGHEWNSRPDNVDQNPQRLADWRDPPFLRGWPH